MVAFVGLYNSTKSILVRRAGVSAAAVDLANRDVICGSTFTMVALATRARIADGYRQDFRPGIVRRNQLRESENVISDRTEELVGIRRL